MADVIDTVLAKKTLEDLVPVAPEKVEVPPPKLTETTVNAIINLS